LNITSTLKPFLTILLPLSRVDDFFMISIQSLKDQTFTDYVCYLLAPPLSTDELCKIQQLIIDDPRFLFHELSLGGIAFALNYGLNISTTKY
jgi:glycosyltransferase involved in cell wall biosynthesis